MTPGEAIFVIVLLIAPVLLYAWIAEGARFAMRLGVIVGAAAAWAFGVLYFLLTFMFGS